MRDVMVFLTDKADLVPDIMLRLSHSEMGILHCIDGLLRFGEPLLARELGYLRDKGFIEAAPKVISPENPAWRITAAGRDLVAATSRR
jgi:hypothetical protein